jgi:hypothetical protein
MELVISDGAQVHITVGHPPLLAPPSSQLLQTPSEAVPPPRRRPLVKGVLVMTLLVGAFLVGRHYGAASEPIGQATAALSAPNPGPLLDRDAVGPPQGEPVAQVPPALAEALRQPPTVVPPPGQAAPPGSAPDPFGLHE